MQKYFLDVLIHHYADFKGRATRTQYWLWVLWEFIVYIILVVLSIVFGLAKMMIIAIIAARLLLMLPNLAIITRRLRDGGFSPWLVLLGIINYLYFAVSMLMSNSVSTQENPALLIILTCFALINFLCGLALFILMCLPSKQTQPEQLN